MPSRFRKSFEQPEPMVPGQITPVSFTLPDILHTFRRGHRVQVQVQSSWFPLVDRNPQTFIPNIARAQASDFRKAVHQVHRTPENPSALTVRVLPNGGR
jgi:predicted acyl esterase